MAGQLRQEEGLGVMVSLNRPRNQVCAPSVHDVKDNLTVIFAAHVFRACSVESCLQLNYIRVRQPRKLLLYSFYRWRNRWTERGPHLPRCWKNIQMVELRLNSCILASDGLLFPSAAINLHLMSSPTAVRLRAGPKPYSLLSPVPCNGGFQYKLVECWIKLFISAWVVAFIYL